MKPGSLDRRSLLLLGLGVGLILVLRFGVYRESGPALVAASVDSVSAAERRLEKLRQIASTLPGKRAALNQAREELAGRERGLIRTATAPQAQAQILQAARRLGAIENIAIRGGELGQPRPFGADYGEVPVTFSFECRIEQLVNFLAGVANEADLLSTGSLRVASTSSKDKSVSARLELSGLVPRKLVPERKGFGQF